MLFEATNFNETKLLVPSLIHLRVWRPTLMFWYFSQFELYWTDFYYYFCRFLHYTVLKVSLIKNIRCIMSSTPAAKAVLHSDVLDSLKLNRSKVKEANIFYRGLWSTFYRGQLWKLTFGQLKKSTTIFPDNFTHKPDPYTGEALYKLH